MWVGGRAFCQTSTAGTPHNLLCLTSTAGTPHNSFCLTSTAQQKLIEGFGFKLSWFQTKVLKNVLCALAHPASGVHTITQTIPCETTKKDTAGMYQPRCCAYYVHLNNDGSKSTDLYIQLRMFLLQQNKHEQVKRDKGHDLTSTDIRKKHFHQRKSITPVNQ